MPAWPASGRGSDVIRDKQHHASSENTSSLRAAVTKRDWKMTGRARGRTKVLHVEEERRTNVLELMMTTATR